jgi:hypothetical protein
LSLLTGIGEDVIRARNAVLFFILAGRKAAPELIDGNLVHMAAASTADIVVRIAAFFQRLDYELDFILLNGKAPITSITPNLHQIPPLHEAQSCIGGSLKKFTIMNQPTVALRVSD